MYCKHCGKEIADDSRFCQHCGNSQFGKQNSFILKPVWIIYFMWFIVNFYLLLGDKSDGCGSHFFPSIGYSDWDKYYYDFEEFLVYVFIIPAFLFVIYKKYKKHIDAVINKVLRTNNDIEKNE